MEDVSTTQINARERINRTWQEIKHNVRIKTPIRTAPLNQETHNRITNIQNPGFPVPNNPSKCNIDIGRSRITEASKAQFTYNTRGKNNTEIELTFAGQAGYPFTLARTRSPGLSCSKFLTRFPPLLRPGGMVSSPQTLTRFPLPGTPPPADKSDCGKAKETLGLRSKGGSPTVSRGGTEGYGGRIGRRRRGTGGGVGRRSASISNGADEWAKGIRRGESRWDQSIQQRKVHMKRVPYRTTAHTDWIELAEPNQLIRTQSENNIYLRVVNRDGTL